MAYIQELFTTVQQHVYHSPLNQDIISFLDNEPDEFRSIAYESASVEIGLKDIVAQNSFEHWLSFNQNAKEHSFHVQIGLGWAFAKTETFPPMELAPKGSIMRLMVYDGIGYFNGLFRGRKTIKNQIIPIGMNEDDLKGFDQGLGRRMWYHCQGDVEKLSDLIMTFPMHRHADLWRGVGIACGYVGGNSISNLQMLIEASDAHIQQLCTGISLAARSRYDSNTMTPDIRTACEVICKMTVAEILEIKNQLLDQRSEVGYHKYLATLEKVL